MAKDAYYFPHDSNAHNDPKIQKMMFDLKAVGYGAYWVIIEMLRNEPNYHLNTSDYDAIAYQSHCDSNAIKMLVENYGLFTINDGVFWSESLNRRMAQTLEKSRKYSENAHKRWNNAMAMQSHSNGNAVKQSKAKERKEKNVIPSDDDFLNRLKTTYPHIDLDSELKKMDGWLLLNPERKKTRRFIVNWLNKVEKPFTSSKTPRLV